MLPTAHSRRKLARRHFMTARRALGASSKYPSTKDFWKSITMRTTFRWKKETFPENTLELWKRYNALKAEQPGEKRVPLMLQALFECFGVDEVDMIIDHRVIPISHPRFVAVALLHRDGVRPYAVEYAMRKDHNSVAYMIRRGEEMLTEMINAENADDWGFASVDQSPRSIQVRFPSKANADRTREQT